MFYVHSAESVFYSMSLVTKYGKQVDLDYRFRDFWNHMRNDLCVVAA